MNREDENLNISSESRSLFGKEDEALDYALALSLNEFEEKSEKKSDAFLNKIDEDSDYAFALSLQEEGAKNESSLLVSTSKPLGIVDEQWEVLDPTPDIRALFLQFNIQFFYGKLDGVEVKWSPRMTLCAGVCSYEGRGGLCSVRLSLPLLKLRPRRDLVETLLHEMIHAYLFVTANKKDHDAHGPEFLKHMSRINKETGTKISVYHNFHDEVSLYQKHIWKCNGPCQKKRPYFGYVKRAVNRAPCPRDPWWAGHLSSCGGTFTKVSEPEDYQKKSKKATQKESMKRKTLTGTDNQLSNIKKFFKTPSSTIITKDASSLAKNHTESEKSKENNTLMENKKPLSNSSVSAFPISETNSASAFTGQGFLLGSSPSATPKTFLANIRREIASSSKVVPKPKIANVHGKLTSSSLKNSTQISSNNIRSITKESCVLGAQTSTLNNVRSGGKPDYKKDFPKTIPPVTKKPSYSQSSIDKFVNSPSRSNVKDATEHSNSNISPKVKCPVCFESFPSSDINTHLDFCLLSRS